MSVMMGIKHNVLYVRGLQAKIVRKILKGYAVRVSSSRDIVMVEPEFAGQYDSILEDCIKEIKRHIEQKEAWYGN